mmetsp:Transcript_24398/g.64353  ORF Transcript_24398/g.64353 Transcript_24398/m.64353 type:complete len:426 (-) Transcript_24398:779-2056(-)
MVRRGLPLPGLLGLGQGAPEPRRPRLRPLQPCHDVVRLAHRSQAPRGPRRILLRRQGKLREAQENQRRTQGRPRVPLHGLQVGPLLPELDPLPPRRTMGRRPHRGHRPRRPALPRRPQDLLRALHRRDARHRRVRLDRPRNPRGHRRKPRLRRPLLPLARIPPVHAPDRRRQGLEVLARRRRRQHRQLPPLKAQPLRRRRPEAQAVHAHHADKRSAQGARAQRVPAGAAQVQDGHRRRRQGHEGLGRLSRVPGLVGQGRPQDHRMAGQASRHRGEGPRVRQDRVGDVREDAGVGQRAAQLDERAGCRARPGVAGDAVSCARRQGHRDPFLRIGPRRVEGVEAKSLQGAGRRPRGRTQLRSVRDLGGRRRRDGGGLVVDGLLAALPVVSPAPEAPAVCGGVQGHAPLFRRRRRRAVLRPQLGQHFA